MTAPSTRPAVTAIVPTHNRRQVLPTTLRSIFGQCGVDLEVVVVDDGSSDGTASWLQGIDDPRLRVLRHERTERCRGGAHTGVDAATTPFVRVCGRRRRLGADKLASQLDAMGENAGARWSCTSSMSFIVVGPAEVELVHYQPAPEARDVCTGLLADNVVPGGGSSVLSDTAARA